MWLSWPAASLARSPGPGAVQGLHHVRSALAHRGGNVELAGAPALLPGGGTSGRCVGPAARHDGGERHRHQRPPGHFAEDVDQYRQAVSDEGGRRRGAGRCRRRAAGNGDSFARRPHGTCRPQRTSARTRGTRGRRARGHGSSEWLKFEAPGLVPETSRFALQLSTKRSVGDEREGPRAQPSPQHDTPR